jgi:RNA polymerase sigma-70 factor (ECF subfamily)
VATDLLHDVIVEAYTHPDNLPEDVEPMPWLLGIALNLIKRRRADNARRNHREPLLFDLYPDDTMSESDIIDRFIIADSPYDAVHHHQIVESLLSQVSSEDEHLLRLAIRHNFDGDDMARELGITPGAARVRLHRAIKRLRQRLGIRQDVTR